MSKSRQQCRKGKKQHATPQLPPTPPPPEARISPRIAVLLVAFIAILCQIPFFNKPAHMDDPLFLWAAQHIATDPLDFFNFEVNWYGFRQMMYQVTQNPPLASYWIAPFGILSNWNEPVLHLAMWLPLVAAACATSLLARKLTDRPILATAITILTPVFIVSGTTLMCDVLMLAFWSWAIYFWIEAIDSRNPLLLCLSGLLIALAILTKYFAVSLLPLLAAYTFARHLRFRSDKSEHRNSTQKPLSVGIYIVAVLIPIGCLTAYDLGTSLWYGTGLFRQAVLYPSSIPTDDRDNRIRIVIGLAMFGGCMLSPMFYLPRLFARRTAIALATAILGLLAIAALGFGAEWVTRGLSEQPRWAQQFAATQAVLMICTALLILSLSIFDFARQRSANSLLLALWIFGTLGFAVFVNWTPNGRTLLPAAPAVGILIARALDWRDRAAITTNANSQSVPSFRVRAILDFAPLIPTTAIALLLARADTMHAHSAKQVALQLRQDTADRSMIWFQGHWGFQYYMQRTGARPFDVLGIRIRPNDRLVIPTNAHVVPAPQLLQSMITTDVRIASNCTWASLMREHRTGFYSAEWGPLPFAFGPTPRDQYFIFQPKPNRPGGIIVEPNQPDPMTQLPDTPARRRFQRIHSKPTTPSELRAD